MFQRKEGQLLCVVEGGGPRAPRGGGGEEDMGKGKGELSAAQGPTPEQASPSNFRKAAPQRGKAFEEFNLLWKMR